MHPLVRWQFRGGIEESERKAFLFTNVTTAKGSKYDIPVVVGGLAANREIYRIGVGCPLEKIDASWVAAEANPIPPRVVENAPCHEIVFTGADLDKPGKGLDGIPVPISTPGWDNAPYTTLSQYITKRSRHRRAEHRQLPRPGQDAAAARHEPVARAAAGHLQPLVRLQERGSRRCPPRWCSARRRRHLHIGAEAAGDVDELHVAGGLVGAPINVVKAKTVDLLVPAEAEIVIEGFIDTE